MSEEILLSAIGYLDEDIVGEYVEKKLKLQESETRKKSTLLTKISLVAAALVLVFSAFIIWQSSLFESAEAVAPDMSKVMWGKEQKPPYVINTAPSHFKDERGFTIARDIETAFLNNADPETVFAVLVRFENNRADNVEKASRDFQRAGIYCEVKNERVFIFVTEEQFQNLKLNFIQKKNYVFDLAQESYYE